MSGYMFFFQVVQLKGVQVGAQQKRLLQQSLQPPQQQQQVQVCFLPQTNFFFPFISR